MSLDKSIRNALRSVVTQCRQLLEESVGDVLEGQYGIHRSGSVEPESAVAHLSPEEREYRAQVLSHLKHIRVSGWSTPRAATYGPTSTMA